MKPVEQVGWHDTVHTRMHACVHVCVRAYMCARVCLCVLKVGDKKCFSKYMERLVIAHRLPGSWSYNTWTFALIRELFVVCVCVGVTEKPVIWC